MIRKKHSSVDDLFAAIYLTPAEIDESKQSERAGFRQTWGVQPPYEIHDSLLIWRADQTRIKTYYPIVHKTIPSELSKIPAGDERAILHFAEAYGHLGYDQLVNSEKARNGDPVVWIWAHARLIRLCLELADGVYRRDKRKLFKSLGDFQQSGINPKQVSQPVPEKELSWCLIFRDIPLSEASIIPVAEQMLLEIVNRNIRGVQRVVSWHGNRKGPFYQFRSLIEVAYWHLADVIESGVVKQCQAEGCGFYFIQTDGRQRFCPPRFDPYSPKRFTESPCAVRERIKRFRNPSRKSKKEGAHHGKTRR